MDSSKPTIQEVQNYIQQALQPIIERLDRSEEWTLLQDIVDLPTTTDLIDIQKLPQYRYLKMEYLINRTGGTMNLKMQFNGDTGNNYAWRDSANGAADTTSVSTDGGLIMTSTGDQLQIGEVNIYNAPVEEGLGKTWYGWCTSNAGGAAVIHNRREMTGKWAVADAIESIQIRNYSGTGDMTGIRIKVYGRN